MLLIEILVSISFDWKEVVLLLPPVLVVGDLLVGLELVVVQQKDGLLALRAWVVPGIVLRHSRVEHHPN